MDLAASLIGRRAFLAAAGAAAFAATQPGRKLPICAFSKHFQWTTAAEAAKLAAGIGFDALDLTVRAGGHVLPERVADDLPKAVEAIRAEGLEAPMITAGIVNAGSPHAEQILKTASALGIKRYRWGGFRYDTSKSIHQQITEFRAQSQELAALNRAHGVCAMYHTHSGIGQFGASMWDIWMVLKDLDHDAVSVNLDIAHATIEGGLGGWINSSRLLLPVSRGIAIKDFRWEKNAAGKWAVRWCPLGGGMVNLAEFFKIAKAVNFSGPVQVHMEYRELGGADTGKTEMSISRDEFMQYMKRDVTAVRSLMGQAGLA
ncbi:MAG: TIM barrel protein [Acidimicrobiia bacterium]|nr:TIM barrel protein [Acidimicrobiia bacterium]